MNGPLNKINGIDEAILSELIPRFYAPVRDDALIGPIFDNAIDHWEEHLQKLIDFWSSVMLTRATTRAIRLPHI